MNNYLRYFKTLAFLVPLSSITPHIFAQSVTLAWTPSDNPNISHYSIYRTTDLESGFMLINTVDHPDTISIDETVQLNSRFYYVATTVDQFGNESGFSNMVDTTLSFPTSVDDSPTNGINEFRLQQNYPNPFNPSTSITYYLPENGHVELTLFNVQGQIIQTLVDKFQEAGQYTVKWHGRDQSGRKVSTGTYFYKIKALYKAIFRRMVLVK